MRERHRVSIVQPDRVGFVFELALRTTRAVRANLALRAG